METGVLEFGGLDKNWIGACGSDLSNLSWVGGRRIGVMQVKIIQIGFLQIGVRRTGVE